MGGEKNAYNNNIAIIIIIMHRGAASYHHWRRAEFVNRHDGLSSIVFVWTAYLLCLYNETTLELRLFLPFPSLYLQRKIVVTI